MGKLAHSSCGGIIENKTCKKCGKVWKGRIGWLLAQDVEPYKEKFDPEAYRKRIRRGKDVFKE